MIKKEFIVIHHFGYPKASFAAIRSKHVEEYGWSDVGYHFIIGNGNGVPDGEVLRGRPIEKGACQSRGMNSKAIGILMVGNFDISYPSKTQWTALIALVMRLMQEHEIPADNVIGHREIYAMQGREPERSCPGWKFDMDKLRKEVYPGGSEIFTDGARRRYDLSVVCDGLEIPEIEPVMAGNEILIKVADLEKVFDVSVEFHPKMRRVEITTIESRG